MKWDFHPEALEEYREATLYYAARDPALALRFIESVEDAIRRILESRNAGESLTRMSDAALHISSLTEFCTPSNRSSSLSLPSCIVVASRVTGSKESRCPDQWPHSTKRVSLSVVRTA